MLSTLLQHFSTRFTPQTEPIPGTAQVPNSAGGYAWLVDDWARLDRFLVLGTEGGSYYASERKLTREAGQVVFRLLSVDGPRLVERIAVISEAGRAPKNDPAIFALAMALKLGDESTRRTAAEAVPRVCRTGTHILGLAAAVKAFGGWGRVTQRAFTSWYEHRPPGGLAYQVAKYRRRHGWTHRDVLRKAHARPADAERDAVYRWAVRGWEGKLPKAAPTDATAMLWAVERAHRAERAGDIVRLIAEHGLVREAIPNRWLDKPAVWEALLDNQGRGMPITALLRNLGKLSSVGVLAPMSDTIPKVVARITDPDVLRRGRVHPIAVLAALTTYRRGRGVRGSLSWRPVRAIVDALDTAFYLAFRGIRPTHRRHLLAIDVSGSMASGSIAALPGITPRVGAAAMAMVTARTESVWDAMGFSSRFEPLELSAKMRLDQVVAATSRLAFGGTDCALPMVWARENRVPVDVFVVYTDNETWFGNVHPVQALAAYRQQMGIPAKLVVVGMVSNGFSIADPNDGGMLDIVGFDTAAPELMADFVRQTGTGRVR